MYCVQCNLLAKCTDVLCNLLAKMFSVTSIGRSYIIDYSADLRETGFLNSQLLPCCRLLFTFYNEINIDNHKNQTKNLQKHSTLTERIICNFIFVLFIQL